MACRVPSHSHTLRKSLYGSDSPFLADWSSLLVRWRRPRVSLCGWNPGGSFGCLSISPCMRLLSSVALWELLSVDVTQRSWSCYFFGEISAHVIVNIAKPHCAILLLWYKLPCLSPETPIPGAVSGYHLCFWDLPAVEMLLVWNIEWATADWLRPLEGTPGGCLGGPGQYTLV